MEIKIFEHGSCDGIVEEASAVYKACGFWDEDENTAMILNSTYIGIVYLDGEPVGIGRVISDNIRHSLIVDLNVVKSYQGKGCGKALVVALAKHAKTKHVNLTTDPNNPTLQEFYKKSGFKLCEDEFIFSWTQK